MTTALVRGLLASGVCAADRIVASDVSQAQLDGLAKAHAIQITTDNAVATGKADVVVWNSWWSTPPSKPTMWRWSARS
jgi:pyrroline-5-carboxylate reductase